MARLSCGCSATERCGQAQELIERSHRAFLDHADPKGYSLLVSLLERHRDGLDLTPNPVPAALRRGWRPRWMRHVAPEDELR